VQKRVLPAPGPAPVPPGVLLAVSASITHHRVPVFEKLMGGVRKGCKVVFRRDREALVFTASSSRTWPWR